MSLEENKKKTEQLNDARKLRKQQEKVKSKYEFLKDVSHKYFQSEYVKAQAEEICRYITEIQMSPLNPWYSKLLEVVTDGKFMSQFYLTLNDFDVIEPDYVRIETLILPDPKEEDFPKIHIFS